MNYTEKKERELAKELNTEGPSLERRKQIAQELELLGKAEKMILEEKRKRELELGIDLQSPDFTPEKGKEIYKELEILRQGETRLPQ